jgi:hypothetical protein
MTTRRFTSMFGLVACLTIGLYLGLVVLATGCASMPLSSSGAHHHSHESAHSPLCAWSCQMLSQSGLVVSAPAAAVSLVAISVVASVLHSYSAFPSAPYTSRAPPPFLVG